MTEKQHRRLLAIARAETRRLGLKGKNARAARDELVRLALAYVARGVAAARI